VLRSPLVAVTPMHGLALAFECMSGR
jgi:hypothetical protein